MKDGHLKAHFDNLKKKPTGITEDFCLEKTYSILQPEAREISRSPFFLDIEGSFILIVRIIQDQAPTVLVAIDENGETIVGQILLFWEQDWEVQCLVQLYEIVGKILVDLRSAEFAVNSDFFDPLAYRVAKSTDV